MDVGQHERHASAHSLVWRAAVGTDERIAGKHALSKDLRKGDIQSLAPVLLNDPVGDIAQEGSPPVD
eukprot:4659268-Alexandrium_andersonii.AAC.1